jgi:DNA-directed RNA polymerase II subunit RPB2
MDRDILMGQNDLDTISDLRTLLMRQNNLNVQTYVPRKISIPKTDTSTNKLTVPRHIHASFYGTVCPLETPEGSKIGIIKTMNIPPKI